MNEAAPDRWHDTASGSGSGSRSGAATVPPSELAAAQRARAPAPRGATPAASRRRRVARRLLAILAVAAAGVAVLWLWVLPAVLGARVREALVDVGLGPADLRVAELSLTRVELRDVELGAGSPAPLRIARVGAGFRLDRLLAGRLREVVLADAVWELQRGADGGIGWAPLDALRGPASDADATAGTVVTAPVTAPPPALPALPFDRVRVEGLTIVPPSDPEAAVLTGPVHAWAELTASSAAGSADGDGADGDGANGGASGDLHGGANGNGNGWSTRLEARAGRLRVQAKADLRARQAGSGGTDRRATAAGPVELQVEGGKGVLALRGDARVTARAGGRAVRLELRDEVQTLELQLGERRVSARQLRVELGAQVDATAAPGSTPHMAFAATLAVPPAGELQLLGAGWPEAVRGLIATGAVRAHATADAGRLELDDLTLRVPHAWRAEGLTGDFAVRSLAPLATAPEQELRWRRTVAGQLEGGAGALKFQVLPGPVLAVERARWSAGAGNVTTGPFRLEASAPVLATRVTIERVPLGDWLRLISQGRVTGQGLLSGWFELRVRFEPLLAVDLGDGRLHAEGGGVIRLLEDDTTRALVEQHAARIAAAAGQQGPEYERVVRERIVESLQDFAFRELSFELQPSADGVDLRVHVAGKGRRVPQEMDLNVNFHGFDALVDLVLGIEQQVGRARQRAAGALGGAPPGEGARSQPTSPPTSSATSPPTPTPTPSPTRPPSPTPSPTPTSTPPPPPTSPAAPEGQSESRRRNP